MLSLLFNLFVTSPVLGDAQPSKGRLFLAMALCFLFVVCLGLLTVA
jgi:hypothetical protein